jgi:hypothetical protein
MREAECKACGKTFVPGEDDRIPTNYEGTIHTLAQMVEMRGRDVRREEWFWHYHENGTKWPGQLVGVWGELPGPGVTRVDRSTWSRVRAQGVGGKEIEEMAEREGAASEEKEGEVRGENVRHMPVEKFIDVTLFRWGIGREHRRVTSRDGEMMRFVLKELEAQIREVSGGGERGGEKGAREKQGGEKQGRLELVSEGGRKVMVVRIEEMGEEMGGK